VLSFSASPAQWLVQRNEAKIRNSGQLNKIRQKEEETIGKILQKGNARWDVHHAN
jgi:hypothetical protein